MSRWDLFHAHAFRSWRDGKLGLLFHAKEYPQECSAFPYNLGYCQQGSPMAYDTHGMDFRNLLFYEVQSSTAIYARMSVKLQELSHRSPLGI